MLNSTSANPITEHSSTLPGRQKRRYSPMNSAMGMVAAIVNAPQGLSLNAFTTTSATTASRMIMISSTVSSAVNPPTLPISSRAIWPSDFPSRRIDANRITKSCTAPPSTAPMMIHSVPGR